MPSHFPTFMARNPDTIRRVLLGPEAYARTVLPSEWLEARLRTADEMVRSFPVLYALVIFEIWHRLFVVERAYERPSMQLAELFRLPQAVASARD
jgi:hypothetical protein